MKHTKGIVLVPRYVLLGKTLGMSGFLLLVQIGTAAGAVEMQMRAQKQGRAEKAGVQTRAVEKATEKAVHGKADILFKNSNIFDAVNRTMYLGSSSANPDKGALISAKSDGKAVTLTALADGTELKGVKPSKIARTPDGRVVGVIKTGNLGNDADVQKKVDLIDARDPNNITHITNPNALIKDSANARLQNDDFVALAASNKTIFAAVPVNAGNFGAAGSGFVRFEQDAGVLKAVVAATGNLADDPGAAYKLVLDCHDSGNDYVPANNMVQFSSNAGGGQASTLGKACDMFWDDKLQRLFVGLSDVRGPNVDAAVESVLVGRINQADNKMFLQPLANLQLAHNPGLFGAIDNIIGSKAAMADDNKVSALKVRTMHTSTGKSYLVVNGGAEVAAMINNVNSKVYALPIINKAVDDPTTGLLARKDGTDGEVNAAAQVIILTNGADALAATVGAAPELIGGADTDLPITDMSVLGDTVYASVNADRAMVGREAGIFQSTALFNDAGLINAWTPWQRAAPTFKDAQAGTVDKVLSFGYDSKSGTGIWVESVDGTAAKSNIWGKSDAVSPNKTRKLTETATAKFPIADEGIFRVFNFDETTPGFADREFAMAVAVGGEKVALIQTGDKKAAQVPSAVKNFQVATFLPTGDLATIAPLTCAEVERANVGGLGGNNNRGFLYVGGARGLARLENNAGDGWSARAAAAQNPLDKLGVGANEVPGTAPTEFTFKKVDEWDDSFVTAMGSDSENLYVLALDKLAKVDLQGAAPANANFAITKSADFNGEKFGNDLVVVGVGGANSMAIIATTAGLFTTNDADTFTPGPVVEGVPVQMVYLSQTRGINSPQGNLLVLAVDAEKNQAKVYRCAVDATAGAADRVKLITGATPIDLKEFRRFMAADGNLLLTTQSGAGNMLQAFDGDNLTEFLDLEAESKKFIGVPVRDTTSGGWIVPGDFGVRVNE